MLLEKMRKRIWIMPEPRDEKFTLELLKRFVAFAKSLGIINFSLEIYEQYETETTPHFHFKVDFEDYVEPACKDHVISTYDATANNETYNGKMQINFRSDTATSFTHTLAISAFAFYDEAIRKYYPEWTTHYKHIEF